MPERSVHVLHALFPRRIGSETQVFLHTHPRWRDSPSGRPMLALPATKLTDRPDANAVGGRLRSVLHADLGLPELAPAGWRQFAEVPARTTSPTHGVMSGYRIVPVLSRLPATTHRRAAQRVGGQWLSPRAALARSDLSPTARAVLDRVTVADLLPPPPSAAELDAGGESALRARLAAARDGDLDQFGVVAEAVRPVLVERLRTTTCTRVLAARAHEIEDVLGDAFAAALAHLEGFDPKRGSPTGWLWVIARNTAVSRLRRKRPDPLTPEAVGALTSGERDPAALAVEEEEVAELHTRLAAALSQAPPRMRLAWTMRADEGQPYAEIAEALGVPFGTLATWIRRIRRDASGHSPDIR